MHLKYWVLGSVLGLATAGKAGGTYKDEHCVTIQGTKKSNKHLPTSTKTHTETYTVRSTKVNNKVTTVTPRTSTHTSTTTKFVTVRTTLEAITKNVEVTSTDYRTTTITLDTATFTNIETVNTAVTSTTTSTVATASNFRPVQTTFPNSVDDISGAPFKRGAAINPEVPALAERQPGSGSIVAAAHALKERSGKSKYPTYKKGPVFYPEKVQCDVTTFVPKTVVVTKPGSTVTITARTPVKTATETATKTITTTIVPAGVTVSITSTATEFVPTTLAPSTTITQTSTITTGTVQVPAPDATPVYAMCGRNNFASRYAANGFEDRFFNFDVNDVTQITTNNNAYECCTRCAADLTCTGFLFDRKYSLCHLFYDKYSVCSPSRPCNGLVESYEAYNAADGYTIGNGYKLEWQGLG